MQRLQVVFYTVLSLILPLQAKRAAARGRRSPQGRRMALKGISKRASSACVAMLLSLFALILPLQAKRAAAGGREGKWSDRRSPQGRRLKGISKRASSACVAMLLSLFALILPLQAKRAAAGGREGKRSDRPPQGRRMALKGISKRASSACVAMLLTLFALILPLTALAQKTGTATTAQSNTREIWRHEVSKWFGQNELVIDAVGWVFVLTLCFVSYFIAKRLVLRLLTYFVRKTRSDWDDIVMSRGVFDRLAYLAPAVVIYYSAYVFQAEMESIIQRLLMVYMLVIFMLIISGLLTAINDIYLSSKRSKSIPIKGYLQIVKIIVFIIGGIVVFATVLDKSPWGILSGLGAMTAILMLVFKDTILSFVASIQLASNDMIRLGDWVSIPQFGADGDVIDIALHTVKVQNWDKTITTVPTHALISQSFKNWRGMSDTGGRRIKRAIALDQQSVKFLDDEMMEELGKIHHLTEYLDQKKTEILEYNEQNKIDGSNLANGRRLTNIGTFRAYLVSWLGDHPDLHSDLTFLVRQLEPTPEGVKIEIYMFSSNIDWVPYEDIQGDIFDHILAVLPQFDLRVFQNPTGHDFARRE